MAPVLALLASNSVAFGIIFGIFVVALLVLIVIVLKWAIGRDRQGREQWKQRQASRMAPTDGDVPPDSRP
jgi:uncharacterized membrane protein